MPTATPIQTRAKQLQQLERLCRSAEVFAAAIDLARENGIGLIAHGNRHYQIVDGSLVVNLFPAEQRFDGDLVDIGHEWDVLDAVESFLKARQG